MSARNLGRQLLLEVEEESLLQLLHSLRTIETPLPSDRIGVPPLDKLLNVFVNTPTRKEPHTQVHWESPSLQLQHQYVKAAKLPIINITGPSACSGKTRLLYYCTAISLLPESYNGIHLGGKGGATVWIDNDGRFDTLRLRDVMLDHLSRCFENSGREILELHDSTVHECLISCLQHLHIFRPQSSGALIATLESVPTYLFDQDRHYSSTKHLQVVVLDSLSAFLWQDRIDEDRKRLDIASTIATTYQTDSTFLQKYHHLVERLTHIQRTFDCAILTSSWSLSSVARTADGPSVRPHLPAIWNNFCAVQIVVERDIIAKFELSISAEEALREGPQRLKAVQENRFKARLNHWGVDGWSDEILQKMRGLGKDREFSFQTVQNGFRLIQP